MPHPDFEQAMAILLTFEDYLAESMTGYLVGPVMTYADLALWLKLEELDDDATGFVGWAERLGLPHLGTFSLEIASRPAVRNYVGSERRMPRFQRCGNDYCYRGDQHHGPPLPPATHGEL